MPSATRYFDLTVKRYETGTVSKYLYEWEPGDTVLMSGPNPGGHWVDGKDGGLRKDFTIPYQRGTLSDS
jgi:NAD(P)H-flavin reductase